MSEIPDHTDDLKIVGKRYYGRWLSALVVLLCVAVMAHSMINNPRFEWQVIAENFTAPSILQGVLMTQQHRPAHRQKIPDAFARMLTCRGIRLAVQDRFSQRGSQAHCGRSGERSAARARSAR